MAIYELASDRITPLSETTFAQMGVLERGDLQRLLRENAAIVAPDTLIICEEFGEWEDSRRRIDLLGIDRDANLIVIELKRTQDGGHMELQAVRYAAMVSTMTFDRASEIYGRYLLSIGRSEADPVASLLDFLGWDDADDERFAQDVRIVLASAEFSKELTSSVLWLNDHGLDIRCVRLKPYDLEGRLLIDAQQVIPLPEAAEYQIRIREKAQQERRARHGELWDQSRFLTSLRLREGEQVANAAKQVLDWAAREVGPLWWGSAQSYGSAIAIARQNGIKYHLFKIRTDGVVVYLFDMLRKKPEFHSDEVHEEIVSVAQQVPGLRGQMDKRPRFPISALVDPNAMDSFLSSIRLMLNTVTEPVPDGDITA